MKAHTLCDRVALKSAHGSYVLADHGAGDLVKANATKIGPWERFTIELH